ncbi:MAG TPA: hypothetical protein VI072_35205 [Polyangiaceae bacterium]
MVNVLSMGMSVCDGLMPVSVRVFTCGHDCVGMIVVAVVVSVSMFVLRRFVYVSVLVPFAQM